MAAPPFFNFRDAIVLFTTVLLALFNAYTRKMILRYRATTIAPIATMGGVVVLFRIATACGSLRTIPLPTGLERIALLFCGKVGGAGFLLLWSWAIEYASAGRIAVLVSGTGLIAAGIYLVYQTAPRNPPGRKMNTRYSAGR